jgi:hypothetical protein
MAYTTSETLRDFHDTVPHTVSRRWIPEVRVRSSEENGLLEK